MGRWGAPELELLASNFRMYICSVNQIVGGTALLLA